MKKIFISIPWFLPAFRAGGPVQSVANLVGQTGLGCRFYIFCGDTDLNGEQLDGIVRNQWTAFNEVTEVFYATASGRSTALKKQIGFISPDKLFIIGLYSWDFNIIPIMLRQYGHSIISVRGMLHPGALTQKSIKKKIFIGWFRLMGFPSKFHFHATDQQEADHIRQSLGSKVQVSVAGNFPRIFDHPVECRKQEGSLVLMCLALISPMKNHLLVIEALSGLEENIDFHIAGPVKDVVYWQACQDAINRLPRNVRVHVHGEIRPNRVGAWLSAGNVFIMPSKSENFGHSLIEAMSAGLPVITSRFTPWNGLNERWAGINVDLDVTAIREAIRFFARMDTQSFLPWQQAASDYARKSVDLPALQSAYRNMFDVS